MISFTSAVWQLLNYWQSGSAASADTSVYFALSTLSSGRASAVKDFRLGLKSLTADVLPDMMQAAKYTDDFRKHRTDIHIFSIDFKSGSLISMKF